MRVDDGKLQGLLEESQDLHSDGMRATEVALTEIVATAADRPAKTSDEEAEDRRRFMSRSKSLIVGAAGAGLGVALFQKMFIRAYADSTAEIAMLQTAAAIENLGVAVYTKAAGLPPAVSGASNPVILKFVQTTIAQHTDHAKAFNAALTAMGGKNQTSVDQPVMDSVVTPALAKIAGPADVVALALTLEDAAAQTYVKFAGDVDPKGQAFGPLSQIAPIEAQHVSVLLAVSTLLGLNRADLITLPANLPALPAAAGSLGFPKSFYSTDKARPAGEGAVS